MGRRIEAGPIVVLLGAGLLLVSLFLEWFEPGATAWNAFEVLDLLLAVLAVAAAVAAFGLLAPEVAKLERRWMAPLALLALLVVASQLIDPPPAVAERETGTGAWLALGGAVVLLAGALLSFSRVRFAVTVEGRDPRRRQAAVVREERPAAVPARRDEPGLETVPAAPPAGETAPPPARDG